MVLLSTKVWKSLTVSNALVLGFECQQQKNQWTWWNPRLTERLEQHDFDLRALQASGSAEPAAGRGSACRIERQGGDWFLRHYRRGGLIGKLLHDQYCWTGSAKTRVARELAVTQRLHDLGLPVPAVVGGRLQRRGLVYRCDLITQALPASQSMAEQQSQMTDSQWQAIGTTVAKFHQQGLWHADLNAHNILLADEQVWVIDFDRATFKLLSAKWQQANMNRLWRSVCKVSGGEGHAPAKSWQLLMAAYNTTLSI